MDVRCDRCKTEHEFDDSLLGEQGITVTCSACRYVFRVMPPSREPTRPSLKVRKVASGRVEPLTSLRDLQRRIHAGEVHLDDELGREGFPFRKLGDVPELRGFFTKTGHQGDSPLPLRGVPTLAVNRTSTPAPAKDPKFNAGRTLTGVGPQDLQIPGPPRMPHVAVPGPAAVGTTKLYLADDEPPPTRATAGSSRVWVIAIVSFLILVGGLMVASNMREAPLPAEAAPPARVESVPAQIGEAVGPEPVTPPIATGSSTPAPAPTAVSPHERVKSGPASAAESPRKRPLVVRKQRESLRRPAKDFGAPPNDEAAPTATPASQGVYRPAGELLAPPPEPQVTPDGQQ